MSTEIRPEIKHIFRIKGNVTLTKTGIENQGHTSFCWLFAVARSVVKSMWMKLGSSYDPDPELIKNLGTVSDTEIKNRATKFLQQKNLYQIVRREICFGLIPKTLKRK